MRPPSSTRWLRPGGVLAALRGVGRVARGRADGVALFDDTPRGFVTSLAPITFMLFLAALLLVGGDDDGTSPTDLAAAATSILASLVISEVLAAWWDRQAAWLRFATALNWCQWAMLGALVAGLVLGSVLIALGMAVSVAPYVVIATVFGYGFWLDWFVVRHALDLSRGRALAFTLLMNAGTALVVKIPYWLAG